jgi:hypothetical protein
VSGREDEVMEVGVIVLFVKLLKLVDLVLFVGVL